MVLIAWSPVLKTFRRREEVQKMEDEIGESMRRGRQDVSPPH